MSQRGTSKLGALITLLLFVVFAYFGWQAVNYFYSYYALQNEFSAQARRASVNSIEKIRQRLIKKMKTLDIPYENERDLIVQEEGEHVRIEIQYYEDLYLDLGDKTYYLYEFHFHPQAYEKKDYSKSKVW